MLKRKRDLSFAILAASTLTMVAFSQDRILYTTLRPANWDIYLFDARGGEPRRLTDDPSLDYNPAFSPDGRWVVFCSERRGNPDLYALDIKHGGAPKLLTENDSMEDAPAFSPDGKRIVFVSDRDGSADIFTMSFDPDRPKATSKAVNLTRSAGGNYQPAFSPDGKRIAFSSARAHADGLEAFRMMRTPGQGKLFQFPTSLTSIYVMDADGANVKRLTQPEGVDGSPVWSADGKSIYFYSKRSSHPNYRIWKMNADGSSAQPITSEETSGLSPAVTREGRVAFSARINKQWRIVSIGSDGGEQQLESDAGNQYWAPDFDPKTNRMVCYGPGPLEDAPQAPSMNGTAPFLVWEQREEKHLPDRTLKLFASRGAAFPSFNPGATEVVSGFYTLATSEMDGKNLRVIHESQEGHSWSPNWSPNSSEDGQWIVFNVGGHFTGPEASAHIWKIRPDGGGAVNLTAGSKGNNAFPAFSPDGRRIVFRSGRDGNHEIYMMDADGKNLRRLTNDPATDTMPAFSPNGDQIAFSSNRENGYQIYTIDLLPETGVAHARRITNSPGLNMHPRYSPDGEWLIFTSDRGGFNDESPLMQEVMFLPQPYGEIYALRLKDGLIQRLTHNKWEDGMGAWAQK
jgi:Tol biopolymer transport system component